MRRAAALRGGRDRIVEDHLCAIQHQIEFDLAGKLDGREHFALRRRRPPAGGQSLAPVGPRHVFAGRIQAASKQKAKIAAGELRFVQGVGGHRGQGFNAFAHDSIAGPRIDAQRHETGQQHHHKQHHQHLYKAKTLRRARAAARAHKPAPRSVAAAQLPISAF